MNRTQLRDSVIAGAAASALLLGTGTAAHAADVAPPQNQPSQSCSDLTGEEAVSVWGALVLGAEDSTEMLDYADTSGYDRCADLSWIVVPHGGTASSANSVMLFHHGIYKGTATAEPQAFVPQIERIDDGAISITYRYLEGDEPNAAPQGRAESTFTWNDASDSVDHEGEFPPTV